MKENMKNMINREIIIRKIHINKNIQLLAVAETLDHQIIIRKVLIIMSMMIMINIRKNISKQEEKQESLGLDLNQMIEKKKKMIIIKSIKKKKNNKKIKK